MSNEFLNILRSPDNAIDAVEGTEFRFDKNPNPDTFVSETDEKQYDRYKGYDGVRIIHTQFD